ncbi:hypothetical protein DRO59_01005 [Candidatus Bathyarchaeota archaeon]|nr:MAG: hypothetical protein DRO59_01005 [Candidatus Bathyarchaeota archaeon]
MKQATDFTGIRLRVYNALQVSIALYAPVAYTDSLPEFASACATKGGHIYLRPSLPKRMKEIAYAHELLHHTFLHIERGQGRQPVLWNLAADHVVHKILTDIGFTDRSEIRNSGLVFFERAPDGPVEVVYRWLVDQIGDALSKGLKQFTVGGISFRVGDKGPGDGFGPYIEWHDSSCGTKGVSVASRPEEGGKLEGSGLAREEFADALRKSKGDLPTGLAREFDRAVPKVRWTLYVRSKVVSAVGRRSKYFTYTRIPIWSRACFKTGIRIPGSQKCSTQVVAAIDTSGSISRTELTQFMTELEQLKRVVTDLYVYVCDAKVHEFYHNPAFPVKVSGGGGCVGPGALVLTSRGCKKIEDVKVGDSVFAHDGKLRRVLEVYRNDGDTRPCYRVQTAHGQEVILTYNHPLYVLKPRSCGYDRSSPCIPGRHSQYCEKCNKPHLGTVGWMTVDQMYKQQTTYGYFAVVPIIGSSKDGTYDDGYLTGFFVGDGWAGSRRRTIRMEFYVGKQDNPEKLVAILSRYGSVSTSFSKDTKRYCLCNKKLGIEMRDIKYNPGRLLETVLSKSREWCEGFLDGIVDADGYYVQGHPKRRKVQLSNWEYTNAVMLACYKTGRLFSVREFQQPKGAFGRSHKKAWVVLLSEPSLRGSGTYSDGAYLYTRVRKIEPVENPGVTFNLKVQGSESYLLQHVGSHNTDFRPIFEDVEERRLKPTILVYFTDGYGAFPEKAPPYPVLWVVVEGPGTIGVEFPFGRVLMI